MAMNKQPFVTIALLTYNRAKTIGRSIDSLLAQTHKNFELVINDDCSTDDTRDVCMSYVARDSRVRYVSNASNVRYARNQTAAMNRATAEYVAIVHDGDVYRKDLIEKWVRGLMQHQTAAIVFNDYEYFDSSYVQRLPLPELVPGRRLFDAMLINECWWIFGIVMVRRSCVSVVGKFDERLPTLADLDMWLRLLWKYDAVYVPEPLLRIAPRESVHHNRPFNWDIQRQMDYIQWVNLARSRPAGHQDRDRLLKVVDLNILRRALVIVAWAFRKGNVLAMIRGILHIASISRRRRYALACAGAQAGATP
jgi:glycosyltransferase involved in cell wall biosynthesis